MAKQPYESPPNATIETSVNSFKILGIGIEENTKDDEIKEKKCKESEEDTTIWGKNINMQH